MRKIAAFVLVLLLLAVAFLGYRGRGTLTSFPKILLIGGTSSSGKTSAVRELRTYYPHLYEDGIDSVMARSCPAFIQELSPFLHEQLLQILAKTPEHLDSCWGLFEKPPEFPSGLSSKQLKEMQKLAIDLKEVAGSVNEAQVDRFLSKRLADQLLEKKQLHSLMVLDVVYVSRIKEELLKRGVPEENIATILLYLPPENYLQRVQKRNEKAFSEGELDDVRFPMFYQFAEIFSLCKECPSGLLGPYSYEQILQLLELGEEEKKKIIEQKTGSVPKREEAQKKLLKVLHKLDFQEKTDQGYLEPRENYDLLINTSDHDAKSVAQQIIKENNL